MQASRRFGTLSMWTKPEVDFLVKARKEARCPT
jgi:hypothetical protein